jgi:hypothetical protein
MPDKTKTRCRTVKRKISQNAPVAQLEEHLATNEKVAGSTPVGCSTFRDVIASVTQLVEDPPLKREVAGSIPARSTNREFFDEKGRKVFIHPMFEIATNPTIKISEIVKRWACRQGFIYIEMDSEVEIAPVAQLA